MSVVSEKINFNSTEDFPAIPETQLRQSLLKTADWFRNSGIMDPNDGTWGVAERILLTDGNSAVEQVYRSFPAWSEFDGYSIIEQRWADCNLETAFMYLLMADALGNSDYRILAENLLKYLFNRSGLLVRSPSPQHDLRGAWNWSHIKHGSYLWLDDNSWMCALQLMIARQEPELDTKFGLTEWALKLAYLLEEGFKKQFPLPYAPEFIWSGKVNMPHWGSLVVMALARAYQAKPEKGFREVADIYHKFLLADHEHLSSSECAYAAIGAAMAHYVYRDRLSLETAELFSAKLLEKMDPRSGNIPAEHIEAPAGPSLVDTIYTINWALPALQCMADLTGRIEYVQSVRKIQALLLQIQDNTPARHLYGCWRGMYDLKAKNWGGGDRYEGGANSIYSGWTNAPIAWTMAFSIKRNSLIQY